MINHRVILVNGAPGGTRTPTPLRVADFEFDSIERHCSTIAVKATLNQPLILTLHDVHTPICAIKWYPIGRQHTLGTQHEYAQTHHKAGRGPHAEGLDALGC